MCKLKISGRKLKYQELLTFSEHVIKHLPESIHSADVVVNFIKSYHDFYHAINRKNSIQLKQDLSADDKAVCQARQAFRAILIAGAMHPDPFVAEACKQIEILVPRIADPNRMTREFLFDACQKTLDRLNAIPESLIQQFECIRPYIEDFSHKMNLLLNNNNQLKNLVNMRKSNNLYYRRLTSSWHKLQTYLNYIIEHSKDSSIETAITCINDAFQMISNSHSKQSKSGPADISSEAMTCQ